MAGIVEELTAGHIQLQAAVTGDLHSAAGTGAVNVGVRAVFDGGIEEGHLLDIAAGPEDCVALALTLGAVNGDTVDGCAVCDVKTVGKLDGAAVAAADGFPSAESVPVAEQLVKVQPSLMFTVPILLL